MTPLGIFLLLAALLLGGFALSVARKRPLNERDWKSDFGRTPRAEFGGDLVTLQNVRATRYPDPGKAYEVVWEDRRYDLSKLRRLWFIVEPFQPKLEVIAHTFLSFEFEDDFLALSIEARTQRDEAYSIVRGMLNDFELIYSFGTERDLITRRALYLDHQVYLYPLVTPPHVIRLLLEDVLATANTLRQEPRFYHSIARNCTSALRQHANRVRPGSFPPFILADVLPGLSDKVLYDKGWIDTELPFSDLRGAYSIQARVAACAERADFSHCIREGLGVRPQE